MSPVKQSLENREWFSTTHWSVVLAAGGDSSPNASVALEKLCRSYWYPLYGYVRGQGYGAEDAQDFIQGFFARLLEKNYLSDVDRQKGKFRSFLLASLDHFLADEHKRSRAAKRGGGQAPISLDAEASETRYLLEPASDETPARIFERRWAVTLLDQALHRLHEEFARAGKAQEFDQLKGFLSSASSYGAYTALAPQLALSAKAVALMVHRLRQRYRGLVREEVAHTVAEPAEIDEEMRYLFGLIRG